ncbi:hypothetical protein XU18_1929 [Perkinsela sp. CCAP 1560/4]|nr:hypothetical protein XU18_1929 [Perkinsela sp. CCAP 1560/4]|eukprot:KNH07397.1 hypothetical protein XU18_1929 [Perkinsela sp. CCAP 1560/4]
MLRRTDPSHIHKFRAPKAFDPNMKYLRSALGIKSLGRLGLYRTEGPSAGKMGFDPNANAMPMLTNTDFGFFENAANTHWAEMGAMLPRKGKGLPPWYRGADTYSLMYSEQNRWEYKQYAMVARAPAEYKYLFMLYQRRIGSGRSYHHSAHEALHWLLRMIVENLTPQHVHYLTAMNTLIRGGEYDMARDVWSIMERQQTWPDDKLIACYLNLCTITQDADSAFTCWNRYCTEKRFLEDDETDPKPITRVPFSVTREELFHLPKWKKHFEHDPNMDLIDRNRFNTTRTIYRCMVAAMCASGEKALVESLLDELDAKLLSTPTPVPEPPTADMPRQNPWDPYLENDYLESEKWAYSRKGYSKVAFGPTKSRFSHEMNRQSNENYLLHVYATVLQTITRFVDDPIQQSSVAAEDREAPSRTNKLKNPYEVGCALILRCENVLKNHVADIDIQPWVSATLEFHRVVGGWSGKQLHAFMHDQLRERGEVPHEVLYVRVLRGLHQQSCRDITDAERVEVLTQLGDVLKEMASIERFQWSLECHFHILACLVFNRTMSGNTYFIENVQRSFAWDDACMRLLYHEYKLHEDVDTWAELTKRMLVWGDRYGVEVTEETRRLIEKDYAIIGIQMRKTQALMNFQYRHQAECKQRNDPTAQLPNPVQDRVSHSLPFPDRDTGYMNEYGELGQWRQPNEELGTKGPAHYAPRMYGETQKGYHSMWRDRTCQMRPVKMPAPFDRKYKEYARGKHPSYDMQYAGPHPEIFPTRYNFRRKTRWDFQDVHQQSKWTRHGPL